MKHALAVSRKAEALLKSNEILLIHNSRRDKAGKGGGYAYIRQDVDNIIIENK